MRVLLIGSRDASGWGRSAIDQALALDAAGVDVVPRLLPFDGTASPLPERILELMSRPCRGCDIVIQHVLPSAYEHDGHFRKNIGYYFVETSRFDSSNWPRYINLMDEAWVPCRHNRDASLESGVATPIRVISPPTDVAKYGRSYRPHKIREELADSFLFYFVGEATPRKDIPALIQAFHLEFGPDEPVELVIKSNIRGVGPDEAKSYLRGQFAAVKRGLNLYRDLSLYKDEYIVTERLSDEGLMRLHASCDCFVTASHGEGWNIPAFEAMCLGKTPIVPAHSAHLDYIDDSTGWPVDGRPVPVTNMQDAHGDLYTGRQSWYSVDIDDLRRKMRAAYGTPGLRARKGEAGMMRAYDYSYEAMGEVMKGALTA